MIADKPMQESKILIGGEELLEEVRLSLNANATGEFVGGGSKGKGSRRNHSNSGKGGRSHQPNSGKGSRSHHSNSGKGSRSHQPDSGKGSRRNRANSGKGNRPYTPRVYKTHMTLSTNPAAVRKRKCREKKREREALQKSSAVKKVREADLERRQIVRQLRVVTYITCYMRPCDYVLRASMYDSE